MRTNATSYAEDHPEELPTLADAPVGSVWTCVSPTGFCVAMRNRDSEVIRCDPDDPVSWYRSELPPDRHLLVRLSMRSLSVDFSAVRNFI